MEQLVRHASPPEETGMLVVDSVEVNLMAKYGLNSGTLKGELFSTLLTQGSSGMQVSSWQNLHLLTVYNEIDESHPGEVWLLGLMEGEYSDLSIEEKLNALAALTDLLSAGSSIGTEVHMLMAVRAGLNFMSAPTSYSFFDAIECQSKLAEH